MLVIPGIALGVYRRVGTPEAADMPLAARGTRSRREPARRGDCARRKPSRHASGRRARIRGSGAALSPARPLQRGRSCLRAGADPAWRDGRAAGRLWPGPDAGGRRRRDGGRAGGVRTGGGRRSRRPRSPSSTWGLPQPRTATRPRRGRSGPRSPIPRRPAHRGCRWSRRGSTRSMRRGLLRHRRPARPPRRAKPSRHCRPISETA